MGEMADKMQALVNEDHREGDGGDGVVAPPGTGRETVPPPAAEPSNTEHGRQGPPETIPYSRFAEVNSRLNDLKDYETLKELGIEPDSAVRLANFEAAYSQDPRGVTSQLIDNLQDLPAETKTAIKSLLASRAAAAAGNGDGARGNGDGGDTIELPEDVRKQLAYVDEIRAEREETDRQQRLDLVIRHWDQLDEADQLKTPPKTQLTFIQAAAARGGYETLEQLAEAARNDLLEYRESALGDVVQTRVAGAPRTVPGSATAPSPATEFKDFGAANKQILADIAAGRLPGIEQES